MKLTRTIISISVVLGLINTSESSFINPIHRIGQPNQYLTIYTLQPLPYNPYLITYTLYPDPKPPHSDPVAKKAAVAAMKAASAAFITAATIAAKDSEACMVIGAAKEAARAANETAMLARDVDGVLTEYTARIKLEMNTLNSDIVFNKEKYQAAEKIAQTTARTAVNVAMIAKELGTDDFQATIYANLAKAGATFAFRATFPTPIPLPFTVADPGGDYRTER